VQVPPWAQQAPVGWEHGFGVQVVPAPCHVLGLTQFVCVVEVQVPAWAQQAPAGCGQGFGVQVVFAPCQVLGEAQAACVVTVQVPTTAQQEPTDCRVSVIIPKSRGSQLTPLQL